MNTRDETLLRDMLDMAGKAQIFLADKSQEALTQDEILLFAIIRAIGIIGEAASIISQETRTALPQIPWKLMIGMRNFVIHNYSEVDARIVWKTVIEDLPPLIAELENILPPEEPAS